MAYRGSGSQAAAAVSAALKALDPSLMTVTYPVAFGALTFGLLGEGLHEPLAEAAIGPFSILRTVAMEPGVVPFAIDYAEALIALDRIDEAADVLDWFEHSARRQRRSWALALAQRTRALYFLRLGELPIARVEAEAATAALAGSDHVIDAARAALVAGTVAAAGRDATSANNHLTQASRAFSGHGIMAWAARADAMLRQLADTRRQSASLTATELRVAELAADGLMNREIAIRLHMSPKTVEVHLTRAFAKLGVRRRVELAARLAQH